MAVSVRFSAWAIAAIAVLSLPAVAVERKTTIPALAAVNEVAQQVPIIMGFQLQDMAGNSRLVLELSDPVDFRIFLLSGPDRAVIDMPQALWRVPDSPKPVSKAIIKGFRFGLFRKDVARLVLDLKRPVKVENAEIVKPKDGAGFKLVLDLAPATMEEFTAQTGWPKSLAMSARDKGVADVTSAQMPLIILDPGHGGMDPGTHGESGLLEKEIALAVARQVKGRLEESGQYRVKLTRERDVFIPLRDRVSIARAAHGDLFVSLHADSNDHREIKGASVYTLSPGASDRETATLAEKENLSGTVFGQEIPETSAVADAILTDLGQREIMNLATRFAETVVGTLPEATNVHSPLPHRSANFAVLKAPDIPSVLVELGYLTNADDEQAMGTTAWQNGVARAISTAIQRHFAQAHVLQQPRAEAKLPPLSRHIPGVSTPLRLSSRALPQ